MADLKARVVIDVTDKATKKLNAIDKAANKLNAQGAAGTDKWTSRFNNLNSAIDTSTNKLKSQQQQLKKNNSLVDSFGRALRNLLATYGGVMTIRAIITTSDTITAAENKLNYINGGDTSATSEQMDKMYAASQRARTDYNSMMSNVGKSMTLAPDAFQGNIDNAIRFQEIMAKSYTLGGASAQEQASSMYQMVQAFGADKLAGDELRSVREGAPLAYKAIEEFAQGIYGAEENLEDLASEGKITADIVTAAIMQSGENIDAAFAQTDTTFAQTFTKLKNTAIESFRTIQDRMNAFLNSETGEKLISGITVAIQVGMKALDLFLQAMGAALTWVVDNWAWLQWIVYGVVIALNAVIAALIFIKIQSWIAAAQVALAGHLAWLPWMLGIFAVVALIWYLASSVETGVEFILEVVHWAVIIILAYIAAVAMASWVATGAITLSITAVFLFWVGIIALAVAMFIKFAQKIVGTIYGIGAVFAAIFNNIGVAWGILWRSALALLLDIVNECMMIISPLLEGINGILSLAGKKTIDINWAGKLSDKLQGEINGLSSELDLGSKFNEGYAKGSAIGAGIQNGINSTFDKVKGAVGGFSLTEALGIEALPDPNDPAYATAAGDYTDIAKGIGDTANNTGSMKDSMALAEEDLTYLRQLADMEWKKEFTTANIVVDMKNSNTINNQGDLDGWVTTLTDKLYEELDMVANGVYA